MCAVGGVALCFGCVLLMLRSVMTLSLFHCADVKAREVVFSDGIRTRHFGSFPANRGAAGFFAGLLQCLWMTSVCARNINSPQAKIIREKQGFCCLNKISLTLSHFAARSMPTKSSSVCPNQRPDLSLKKVPTPSVLLRYCWDFYISCRFWPMRQNRPNPQCSGRMVRWQTVRRFRPVGHLRRYRHLHRGNSMGTHRFSAVNGDWTVK